MGIMQKIFGTYSERELKRIYPIQKKVLDLEEKYRAMSDEELKACTPALKERLANGETLDDILPDAFAVCREAADRVLGMRHFPVQIIGGIVLHQGRIAEMRTGEGKTLVATLPAYLNALSGEGVHIVTVNDYLAKRDSEWMGKVYRFLGLRVGLIVHGLDNNQRRAAYRCDITYGTNNEFGFDYLRDNMVIYKREQVQRGHYYAIVDEVDSILVDEARTPLIISGQGDKSTDLYQRADKFARTLKCFRVAEKDNKEEQDDVDGDYIVDEKAKTVTLTQSGVEKAEAYFGIENLTDADNMQLQHHINQAIRAHGIMQRDVDYVVKDDEVIIVDEFTGRLMLGRRYNEGLHQAIEAKEGVKVERESKTLATITFQNFFRMYNKLSGMTGTAQTEADEFMEIYKLDVIEIPTNRPIQRHDHADVVYKTEQAKFNAVIEKIIECHKKGQPVLVGTISIEKSELLSKMLARHGVKHEVLNAKYHEKEAEIVAQAGKLGAVTIATNMAGRGTDIMLGGNAEFMAKAELRRAGYEDDVISEATGFADTDDEQINAARKLFTESMAAHKKVIDVEAEKVREAGGLFIIGTERHESRRIDNQLRGRAGRQGDPGETRFFMSLEDDLMRLFGGERIQNMMTMLGAEDDMPIEARILTNSIESAQMKVEARNFGIRKSVLQFDDVMNRQREIIYSQRAKVLDGEDLSSAVRTMVKETIDGTVDRYLVDKEVHDHWNLTGLRDYFLGWLTVEQDLRFTTEQLAEVTDQQVKDMLNERAMKIYEAREKMFTPEIMREVERVVLLRVVDTKWMQHIDDMEELKRGMYLRSYAQKDPVVEYRIEGFDMFDAMIESIREDTVRLMFTIQLRTNEEPKREQVAKPAAESGSDGSIPNQPAKREPGKVGRNDPCPCGSGKKYKKCCGRQS
ncbi:preprotein translocase subunit SecA [Anaerotruncus sp. 1XD42-93]|jgi:preprotein translocase subunit SecA|uniref:preprotein translocase subunit SecA n=1 Tax=Anaerotruncus sp. 1XD42-93 TaxID=2320853 RepID=UPI000EA3B9DF|nr:preprotein translocase subunit SecA [Anaerotruncus sp. 1XD42-93]MCI9160036.1 preprotein translocase subunit SecA [Anaerotruncus sp.]MCI9235182.1 preprotein translocase subunit SecA [Anaerotruncus sp.]NBK18317.1 preprotein translocase subunit SecA [Anaerotruncus sp. 1XD42-93]RKJ88917.1 preprotein translocase subunit SecA [Anaerotruncus sp. 1XD22-93]